MAGWVNPYGLTAPERREHERRLSVPIAAFNGGVFFRPDYLIIDQKVLPRTIAFGSGQSPIAKRVIEIITAHGLDVWVYSGNDWFVHKRHGPYVDYQEWVVKFPPIVVPSFDNLLNNVVKIVVRKERLVKRF